MTGRASGVYIGLERRARSPGVVFIVVVAETVNISHARDTPRGDDVDDVAGVGGGRRQRPWYNMRKTRTQNIRMYVRT